MKKNCTLSFKGRPAVDKHGIGRSRNLRVSSDGVFNSLAPAGKVLVGNGFLSFQAYFVAKVLVVSADDVS